MKEQENKLIYRYPGVVPFTTSQSHLFFGREKDTTKLIKLVHKNLLTVVYGKSGYGKSSLINAGVVPKAEQEGLYTPIVIRFGRCSSSSEGFLIDQTVKSIYEKKEKATPPSPFLHKLLETPEASDHSLWYQIKNWQAFHQSRPLLIFDQFEELFTYPDTEIDAFQQQLAELLRIDLPSRYLHKLEQEDHNLLSDEEEDLLEKPIEARALMAIRSDKLHLLNRLKKCFPEILNNNYELEALTLDDARMAITQPARLEGHFITPPFEFKETAVQKLLAFLKDDNNCDEGILIQMLCEHFEKKNVELEGQTVLDGHQIGDPSKVIHNYYLEKINALSETEQKAVCKLIEEGLISEEENIRLSLHEDFITSNYGISKKLLQTLVNNHLLRTEPFHRRGYSYEVAHDRLIPAILGARNQRISNETEQKLKEEATKLKKQARRERKEKESAKQQLRINRGLLIVAIAAFLISGFLGYYANERRKELAIISVKAEKEKLEALEQRAIAEQALAYLDSVNLQVFENKEYDAKVIINRSKDKSKRLEELIKDLEYIAENHPDSIALKQRVNELKASSQ